MVPHTGKYRKEIIDTLLGIDLESRKDTQKGLLLLDIVAVLGELYEAEKNDRIEVYLKKQSEQGNDKVKKEIKKILG